MKKVKLFVVIECEDDALPRALWAGTSEEAANDFADEYWVATQKDTLISPCMANLEEGE